MCGCVLDVFGYTPTGNHTGQPPANFAQRPIRGRLRSARYARLLSNAPGWGAQSKRLITEELLHPLANANANGYSGFPADAQYAFIYPILPDKIDSAGIFKEVGATLDLNTNYTLSIEQGLRTGGVPHLAPLRLQLSAVSGGGIVTPLAFGTFNPPPSLGFEARTIYLTADVIASNYSAFIGQALRVDIINYANGTLYNQLNVDNLSLTALAIPEPSSGLLIAMGTLTFVLHRVRRRKSQIVADGGSFLS